jgi:hypothetical protein
LCREPKTADCWQGTHPGPNDLYGNLWENTRLKNVLKKKPDIYSLRQKQGQPSPIDDMKMQRQWSD